MSACCAALLRFLLDVLPFVLPLPRLLFVEELLDLSSELLLNLMSLFLGVVDVIIRIIDVLRSDLEDVEVVDRPSSMCSSMILLRRRCHSNTGDVTHLRRC